MEISGKSEHVIAEQIDLKFLFLVKEHHHQWQRRIFTVVILNYFLSIGKLQESLKYYFELYHGVNRRTSGSRIG